MCRSLPASKIREGSLSKENKVQQLKSLDFIEGEKWRSTEGL